MIVRMVQFSVHPYYISISGHHLCSRYIPIYASEHFHRRTSLPIGTNGFAIGSGKHGLVELLDGSNFFVFFYAILPG